MIILQRCPIYMIEIRQLRKGTLRYKHTSFCVRVSELALITMRHTNTKPPKIIFIEK